MTTAEHEMKCRTFRLDAEASAYLDTLCPRKRGHGAVVSRLLHEHKIRRECAAQYQMVESKEQWNTEAGLDAVE
jgi:hypothetical protein